MGDISNLPFTGERYVPEIHGQIELEHRHRYYMARPFVTGKRVLDIACGEGYGSDILAADASQVIGIDIDPATVDHAKAKYAKANLSFVVGRCEEIPLANDSVDVVVSFETIEHTREHRRMIAELRRVLAPGGLVVISSPNTLVYSAATKHNPFHLKEVDLEEFTQALQRSFRNVYAMGQRVCYGSLLLPLAGTALSEYLGVNGADIWGKQAPKNWCRYYVVLASNQPLPEIHSGFLGFAANDEYEDGLIPGLQTRLAAVHDALDASQMGRAKAERACLELEKRVCDGDEAHANIRAGLEAQLDDVRQEFRAVQLQYAELAKAHSELEKKLSEVVGAHNNVLGQLRAVQASRWWRLKDIIRNDAWTPGKLLRIAHLVLSFLHTSPLRVRPATARQPSTPANRLDYTDFDEHFYLRTYPDVAAAGMDPYEHYCRYGKDEGRLGHPAAPRLANKLPSRNATTQVVYVSGEPDTPGHTYRIDHHAAAGDASGLAIRVIRMADLAASLEHVACADVLVIWRAPWVPPVISAVQEARKNGAKIVFDVDDLMISPQLATADLIDGIRSQQFAPRVVQEHYASIRETMMASDFCFAPTESLAFHMRQAGKPAFVLPNGFSEAALIRSRLAVRRCRISPSDGLFRIGYATGTHTHQRDFRQVSRAVAQILRGNTRCRLVLFRNGEGKALLDTTEFPEFSDLQSQIEWRQMVSLKDLPLELARFDVNLAPLEVGNPYCECKSELKYFEAGLVDVCTIASPTEPFRKAIRHGENGFLAATEQDWLRSLQCLVNDSPLRQRMARAAFYESLRTYGPRERSRRLASVISQVLGGRDGVREFAMELYDRNQPPRPLPSVSETIEVFHVDHLDVASVTVVIPLYNYAVYVQEALQSVAEQTLSPLDLVVVDDCSTDDSLQVVLEWVRQHIRRFNRIKVLRNRNNQGLGFSRNAGFDAAETPFVLPLDADNRLRPNCCEKLYSEMQGTDLAFAYPIIQQFGDMNGLMGTADYAPVRLTGENYIDAMALIAKEAWAQVGGYDGSRSGWEDYEIWCRMAELGLTGRRVGEAPLAEYRVHGNSMLRTHTDKTENNLKAIALMEGRHFWITYRSDPRGSLATKSSRARSRKDCIDGVPIAAAVLPPAWPCLGDSTTQDRPQGSLKRIFSGLRRLGQCLDPKAVDARIALAKRLQHYLPLGQQQKWWLRTRIKRSKLFKR